MPRRAERDEASRKYKWTSRKYSYEQVEDALQEVARCTGNLARASRQLKERGVEIPLRTLRAWCSGPHSELYQEIRQRSEERTRRALAVAHEDVAREATERVRDGLHFVDVEKLHERDRAGALRNLSTIAGIHSDKAAVLRGGPTEIVEHRHAVDILAQIAAINPALVVDSEAVDEPAQLPEAVAPAVRKWNRRKVGRDGGYPDDHPRHPDDGG